MRILVKLYGSLIATRRQTAQPSFVKAVTGVHQAKGGQKHDQCPLALERDSRRPSCCEQSALFHVMGSYA